MDRIIEERHLDGHDVAIVEMLADEGSGYGILVDGVLADIEPLSAMPDDDQLRLLITRLRGGR